MDNSLCPSDKIVFDEERGEYICTETGEVIEERVLAEIPPRDFYKQVTKHNEIDFTYLTHTKSTIIKNRPEIKPSNYRDRVLISLLSLLNSYGNKLNVPKEILETAGQLTHKIFQNKLYYRKKNDELIITILYLAFKQFGKNFDIKKTSEDYGLDIKLIKQYIFDLSQRLEIKTKRVYKQLMMNYIETHGIKLEEINWVFQVIDKLEQNGIFSGISDRNIASAFLYIALKILHNDITLKQIANITGASEGGVRSAIKKIADHMGLEVVL